MMSQEGSYIRNSPLISRLELLVCSVAVVVDWVARLHYASAKQIVIPAVVGCEVPPNRASAGALALESAKQQLACDLIISSR